MQKITLLLLFTAHVAFGQTDKTIKTTLRNATVFNQGVQLFAKETVAVGSGMTNLVFENVSPYLIEQSLQASAGGGLVITDVRYNLQYAVADKKPDDPAQRKLRRELKAVEDSLVEHGFYVKDIQNRRNNLTVERNTVTGNRMMRGEFQKDSLALFMKSVDFLLARLNEIDAAVLKTDRELYAANFVQAQLTERKAILQKLLSGNYPADGQQPKPVPQVIITVQSDKPVTAELSLNYFVAQAGWTAAYDLRASKNSTDIEMNHIAKVWQNTGLDWKDVLLTLSTGNPGQSNVKPALNPFLLRFYQPNYYYSDSVRQGDDRAKKQSEEAKTNAAEPATLSEVVVNAGPARDEKGVEDYTKVSENMIRVEYEISLPYTILSDGQQHTVVIQNRKIPATYQYSVVPKLDPDAFLMARVTDWEDLKLVPGTARIYFDDSYVGESYINPNTVNDTLLLNLGRDKSIVVKRQKMKDKSKDRVLSDTRVLTREFEITIRNTKNIPIRITVEDQMPVSRDAAIKVENQEDSRASFNADTGKLVWDFKMESKDNKRILFRYEVKYPKDRLVPNL